ncbi:hypothetical protein HDV57DRAFT_515325 [Trichoderma longibrachiatum]|uniref:Ubiquitin 3 binding protein But2 C-terminal domain-containing protein n=1 Tax=Trichoderma longibrachiatum ATCC 18648 TaxID=983965 RepID=A0A2T4C4N0_TRILO|nr:hypothetical protein M440DRAFT_1333136 [Trichoderma longibrachiatum ATCC 18648]
MVIGLLAITAIPTVTGVGQAVSAQKKANAANKEKEKFRLTAIVEGDSEDEDYETDFCVLKDGKLQVNVPLDTEFPGYAFCGYYFTYPSEEKHLGLVSTISDDPPMLNWIYVNKDTHAVEYGGRKDTLGHVIGPWGWSEDEKLLTLQGNGECFVAKLERGEEDGGSSSKPRWVVYWDPENEMLDALGADECKPVRLRRRMLLGMDSKYVRD